MLERLAFGFCGHKCDLEHLFSLAVVVLTDSLDLLLSGGAKCGFIYLFSAFRLT